MKILVVKDIEGDKGLNVCEVADSAIVQSGKPMFVPDFARRFATRLGLAIRIDRLGKHIARRFAPRYFNEVAACCLVSGQDWLDDGIDPETDARALSFDGSLLLGTFQPYDGESDLSLALKVDGTPVSHWHCANTAGRLHRIVSDLSRYFTLKMGDLVICDSCENSVELHLGTELTGQLADQQSLRVRIR